MNREYRKSGRLPFVVISLGITSFLTDVSSEMILPLLPVFITKVLGGSKTSLGLIEGIAESTSSLFKIVSGWASDSLGRRKPFLVSGYLLSNLTKPLLAFAKSWPQVLAIRFTDRVGKGIRTSPRDALIADATPSESRGRSFGFHRAMDTVGAIVGTGIAFAILSIKADAIRTVFALSLIPGVLACLVLIMTVRERPGTSGQSASGTAPVETRLSPGVLIFTFIMVLFTFASPGYAFFIVKANELGITEKFIPLVYLLYNIVYASLAMPVGISSDRFGRETLLLVGFVLNGLLCLGFALASDVLHIWLLFVLFGLVSAVTETVPRALISDRTGGRKRGTGFGVYHTAIGLAALPSGLLFGYLWETFGPVFPFLLTMVFSGIATFLFLITRGGAIIRTTR